MAWRVVSIGAAIVGLPLGLTWLVLLVAQWAATGRWWLPFGLGQVIGVVSWVVVGLTFVVIFAKGHSEKDDRNVAPCDHPQDRQTTQAPERHSSPHSSPDREA